MNEKTIKLTIAAFEDEGAADKALKRLKDDRRKGQLEYRDIAVIRRDAMNRVPVKETGDVKGGSGGLAGSLTGNAEEQDCHNHHRGSAFSCRPKMRQRG